MSSVNMINRTSFSMMQKNRLHKNCHNKCLMAVVTLGTKPSLHVTTTAVFRTQSMTISSVVQLGLITKHRLYQIVSKITGFQLAGGGCFDVVV